MSPPTTQFDYLLNAMENAAQSAEPAKGGYAAKRQAVLAHVRRLERIERLMNDSVSEHITDAEALASDLRSTRRSLRMTDE